MKNTFLVLFIACIGVVDASGFDKGATYKKLCEVNRCWKEQGNLAMDFGIPATLLTDEYAMIKMHLCLVEKILRSKNVSHLSKELKAKRMENLNNLHQYWLAGAFPINNRVAYRNPIFIDEYNHFCAVGYLIKASGNEDLSRMIAANDNKAYLRNMRFVELNNWVATSGLTLDELAWTQPGYPNNTKIQTLGKGTNGTVYSLASQDGAILYAGGDFSQADGSVNAANIAQYNKSTGTWTACGNGFNGPVRKVFLHGSLYAGGSFTESGNKNIKGIAKWNNNAWEAMGAIEGSVNDIAVNTAGTMFIGGNFSFKYNDKTCYNLAFWDGANWRPVFNSIDGTVNSIASYPHSVIVNNDTTFMDAIVFGGSFTHINGTAFKHIAAWDGASLNEPGNGIPLMVNALCVLNDKLYACGEITNGTDSFGFAYCENNNWVNPFKQHLPASQGWGSGFRKIKSFNAINVYDQTLVLSGQFFFDDGGMGTQSGENVVVYDPEADNVSARKLKGIGVFDSTIYTSACFSNGIIMGGAFKKAQPGGWYGYKDYNFVAFTDFSPNTGIAGVEPGESFAIYPNPLSSQSLISGTGIIKKITIMDGLGRIINKQDVNEASVTVQKNLFLGNGIYFIELENERGMVSTRKIVVE